MPHSQTPYLFSKTETNYIANVNELLYALKETRFCVLDELKKYDIIFTNQLARISNTNRKIDTIYQTPVPQPQLGECKEIARNNLFKELESALAICRYIFLARKKYNISHLKQCNIISAFVH